LSRRTRKRNKSLGQKLADVQLKSVDCNDRAKDKYFEIILIVILLVFGIYQSILCFEHQVVPNSDFPGFVRAGRSLLSFELPSSFKHAQVLGLLQVSLSQIGGRAVPCINCRLAAQRDKFLVDKIDVTKYIVKTVEHAADVSKGSTS